MATSQYLVSDITTNPLQHSLTRELSRSERLHLQKQTHALLYSATGTEICKIRRYVSMHVYKAQVRILLVHHLSAQNGSDRLAYVRLVGHIHSPHVGFADECFSIRVLRGDL